MSPMRTVRHLGARTANPDDSKLLTVTPIFAGESLNSFSTRMAAVIDGGGSQTSAYLGEVNFVGLFVPWAVIFTHVDTTGAVTEPSDAANHWDKIFSNLVFEWGTDKNEFYGGDSIQGSVDDVIPEPGASPAASTDQDEPLVGLPNPYDGSAKGPLGVVRLFSEETLMYPQGNSEGANADHAAYFNWHKGFGGGGFNPISGGCVMTGVVRYEAAQTETNFNVEFSGTSERAGFSAMIGGDITRVQQMIAADTTELGDHMRTVLFGGDNFNEGWVSNANASAFSKVIARVNTPYIR